VRAVGGSAAEPAFLPRLEEQDEPTPGAGEVLVAVAAAGLNRVDLLQLRGLYPPPPGESAIPGLEAAGTITALGEGVEGWRVGDRVMALLAGGGQAEYVAVPAGQLLRVPENWSDEEAGGFPEAALTAWTNLVGEGRLREGESVLVNGATSGMGTVAVQLARQLGARVLATGREAARLERLRDLGASTLVPLADGAASAIREATDGRGVDLVFDLIGGDTISRLLPALAPRGRWILIGLMAGSRAELDLGLLLRRRLTLRGSVLRPRSRAEKADLMAGFAAFAAPRLEARQLVPVVDRVFDFDRVADAYRHLARSRPLGKVVLRIA